MILSKALIISDIHLHRWQYGASTDKAGFNSRLMWQFVYLDKVRELALKEDIHDIICLGDLFHTHQTVHAEVLGVAARTVQNYSAFNINFHCLVGNHDMASRDGMIHSLDFLRPYGVVVSHPLMFQINDRKISAMPYTESPEKLTNFLNTAEELVLLHQGVNLHDRGSAWVLNEIFDKTMVPDHVKRVLTGHYHRPIDDGKISIVGSPMEHTWSDYDDTPRGVVIVDLETLATKRVINEYSPRFIKWDFKEEFNPGVENRFVKVYNCPKEKMNSIREGILGNSAVSVEFDTPTSDMEMGEVPNIKAATLEDILAEYERSTDGRKRLVGQLLREQQYETSEF